MGGWLKAGCAKILTSLSELFINEKNTGVVKKVHSVIESKVALPNSLWQSVYNGTL